MLAGQHAGVRRAFVLHDGEIYGDGVAASFTEAAHRSGLTVAGQATWNPKARSFARLAARVRAAGADGVLLAGFVTSNGPRLISDLRAAMPRVALLAPDGFNVPETIVEGAGARAEGLIVSIASAPVRTLPPSGRRWAAAFERRTGSRPCCFATHTGQAMQLVLDAIAASDGSRADVLDRLRHTDVRDGLLGDFRFDRFGDTTRSTIALYRIAAGQLRYLRSIDVPPRLLSRE
jgi:ABC-type branched-subunit amino acid transport system substrate-binding protein